MKQFLLLFALMSSLQSQAVQGPSQVSCFADSSTKTVITVTRLDSHDEASFQETSFFKPLKSNLLCTTLVSEIPESITCRSSNDSDPSIEVDIEGADGVLNIGEMTDNGHKTELHCNLKW